MISSKTVRSNFTLHRPSQFLRVPVPNQQSLFPLFVLPIDATIQVPTKFHSVPAPSPLLSGRQITSMPLPATYVPPLMNASCRAYSYQGRNGDKPLSRGSLQPLLRRTVTQCGQRSIIIKEVVHVVGLISTPLSFRGYLRH